jgi:hypothetical protein
MFTIKFEFEEEQDVRVRVGVRHLVKTIGTNRDVVAFESGGWA